MSTLYKLRVFAKLRGELLEVGVSDRTRQQPRRESYGAVWTSTELGDRQGVKEKIRLN